MPLLPQGSGAQGLREGRNSETGQGQREWSTCTFLRRNSGANRDCDDHCTVVVVILFAPKRCFRQCDFLLPAAFQATNATVTLGSLARKGKVFGTSHVISDHFMLASAVIASSDISGNFPRRCLGVQLKQYDVTLKLRLQDSAVGND